MSKRTDLPIKDVHGRYSAFINAMRYKGGRESFTSLRKYYRINSHLSQSDLIKCGAFDTTGTPTNISAWDCAKELMRITSEREAIRKASSTKVYNASLSLRGGKRTTNNDSQSIRIVGKGKRELLAEYYRIQSQMHAAMSRVCAELAEVA